MSAYQGPRAAEIEARDNRLCVCGHLSLSHASWIDGHPVGVGNGPCGFDHIKDSNPCEQFQEARA